MHKLLQRQLRRLGLEGGLEDLSPELQALVAVVDQSYQQADEDRVLLERSLRLTSEELIERYHQLQRDTDERRKLEMELRQAQKLEAVGQLASGIAHEINTPIQFVGNNLEFVKDAFEDLAAVIEAYRSNLQRGQGVERTVRDWRTVEEEVDLDFLKERIPLALAHALEGVSRVSVVVRAMKEFGRPDLREMVPGDLNRAIETTLIIAQHQVKFVAEVRTELGELPIIPCFLGDLSQVFLNLIVNAADAIAENHPQGQLGQIRISTCVEGDQVEVRVADNGVGIPDHIQSRVFDPFFTTKPVGKGTGQGLAISRSIVVEKHRGTISFETTAGKGTVFTVRLPLR